jgi:rubrerythrin
MQVYICEICGRAYLGKEQPSDCPFCGVAKGFLKEAAQARLIVNEKIEFSDISRKNLEITLNLEKTAIAIYNCMAQKFNDFQWKAFYRQLAKVENEHKKIAAFFLNSSKIEIQKENCADNKLENLKRTIALENKAAQLYLKFAQESKERPLKIFFAALAQVEKNHIILAENYLKT